MKCQYNNITTLRHVQLIAIATAATEAASAAVLAAIVLATTIALTAVSATTNVLPSAYADSARRAVGVLLCICTHTQSLCTGWARW